MKIAAITAALLGAVILGAEALPPPGAVRLEVKVEGAPPPDKLPLGIPPELWALAVPKERAATPQLIALGEKLFNDKRLSADDTVSCATCHEPAKGFDDDLALANGIRKQKTARHSPTIINAVFNQTQFWDGRAKDLEEQALLPIVNPVEMGMKDGAAVTAKLRGIPEYVTEFKKVFGREPSYEDAGRAIGAFERTLIFADAPFDRFIRGDAAAMDAAAKRGWALFNGKARCNACHAGNVVSPVFTDHKFHNIGVAARKQDFVKLAREAITILRTGDQKQVDELAIGSPKFTELGRFLVTKNENEVGAFKTPALRDVAVTAPYMHDGSMETLWDVVDHYNKGGIANPFLDGGMQRLGMTESEIDDLVAFLGALTSSRFTDLGKKEIARQRAMKAKDRPERDTDIAMGKKGNLGDLAPNPDLKNPAEMGVFGPEPLAETEKGARR